MEKFAHRPGLRGFFRSYEEGLSKVGLEPFKIMYKENEIKSLASKLNWTGTGTEIDPIIIAHNEGLPQKFTISTTTLFIHIKKCKFQHIILYKSQNISIEECSFEILAVYEGSNNTVTNSTISTLNLEHSSHNFFKKCAITTASNLKNQANVFEDCILTEQAITILQESYFYLSKFVKQMPYVILTGGICISIFTIIHIIDSNQFDFNWFLMIAAFFCLILVYILLVQNQKKSIPNTILTKNSNNSI